MRGALFALACLAAGAAPASAQAPKLLDPTSEPVAAIAGAWEMSATSNERKCRVQLSARDMGGRRMTFGAPTACKAAIPALTAAAQWGLGEDGAIHIFKADGSPLFLFRRDAAGAFKANDGEFALEALGGKPNEAPRAENVEATLNALTGQTPAKDADRAALAGLYALARARAGEDCALDLKRVPGPRARAGGTVWAASLDETCADAGLRAFDPVGWQFDNGRIFLLAKKGHTIGFTRAGADEWRKDPEAGRPLWMKKK